MTVAQEEQKIKQEKNKAQDQTRAIKEFVWFLRQEAGYQAFMETMKKEFATENLLFWKSVYVFQHKYSSTLEINTQELIDDAVKIYKEFISEDTRAQVNLPGEQVEELKKIFTDGFFFPKGINQWVFKNAYQSILHLMYRDNFSRFKFSESGRLVLESLPPYCPGTSKSPIPVATALEPPELPRSPTPPTPTLAVGRAKRNNSNARYKRIDECNGGENEGLLNTSSTGLFQKQNKDDA
eukprot:TRINITY_DN8506_c0_g1_i1.p1 TRINITY_DN8506_c0_g1~~TRINITY_DN8506_c0_g1_i1.p1  ORF type:complete len:238 (-),score=69.36 TRINITY_DN8506_c0_g1_i1:76-789(-)